MNTNEHNGLRLIEVCVFENLSIVEWINTIILLTCPYSSVGRASI